MTTRLFKIKKKASDKQVLWAKQLAGYLLEKGFDGTELNDLVYLIAEAISLQIKDELGATLAIRIAAQEYTAAEEINQHSIEDQLLILHQWHTHELKSSEDRHLEKILSAALGENIPEKFWLIHA